MTLYWHRLRALESPEGDEWLGPDERKVLEGLRLSKRRAEWRLGRYVAKRALAALSGVERLDRIQIIAAEDGAPEAFLDARRVDFEISISHRDDVGACAVAGGAVGCDLEAIEPRTSRFVRDFFTDREREAIDAASSEQRDLLVALTWSAKESALKVARTGLRRDTRTVEVDLAGAERAGPGWQAITVSVGSSVPALRGWWRADDRHVLTVLGSEQSNAPLHVNGGD